MTACLRKSCRRSSSPCLTGRSSASSRRTRLPSLVATTIFAIAFASGCGSTKTVLVEPGTPVKAGPDVTGRVYVFDPVSREWVLGDHKTSIPEGWLIVSPEDDG